MLEKSRLTYLDIYNKVKDFIHKDKANVVFTNIVDLSKESDSLHCLITGKKIADVGICHDLSYSNSTGTHHIVVCFSVGVFSRYKSEIRDFFLTTFGVASFYKVVYSEYIDICTHTIYKPEPFRSVYTFSINNEIHTPGVRVIDHTKYALRSAEQQDMLFNESTHTQALLSGPTDERGVLLKHDFQEELSKKDKMVLSDREVDIYLNELAGKEYEQEIEH